MISWFAGLFYLPRIYVNLATAQAGGAEYRRLLDMARRLLRFMTPLGGLALLFGLLTPLCGRLVGGRAGCNGKLALGLALAAYHVYCFFLLRDFAAERNRRSQQVVPRVQRNSGAGDGRRAVSRRVQTVLEPVF